MLKVTKRRLVVAAGAMALLVATIAILKSLFIVAVLDGYSMYPTVLDGEIVVALEHWREQNLHGIVVAELDEFEGLLLLKRMAGIPGSSVRSKGDGPLITLGEDEYWLSSDANHYTGHEGTIDSNDFGPVRREDIKAVLVWRTRLFRGALSEGDVEEKFREAQIRAR